MYDGTMRLLVVLAVVGALWGLLPTVLAPVAASEPAGPQIAVGLAPATPDDPGSTSTTADPPPSPGRVWRAALAGGAPAAGAPLRTSAGAHPAHPRLVSSGSSGNPDPRSRQYISPLTVSLRI